MPAGVVADRGLLVLGQQIELDEDLLDRTIGPFGALERLVRVVDVGLVVLVVVEVHRLRVDRGLERVVVVRQRW